MFELLAILAFLFWYAGAVVYKLNWAQPPSTDEMSQFNTPT